MILPAQIIQAPMAGAQGADLAIAVCRAGGIGSLPAAMLSADILSQELEKIIQSVGDSPYNVNFFAHKTPSVSEQERAKWLTLLQPYLQEYGVSAEQVPAAPSRQPFNEEMLAIVQKYRPPIVSFHFGLPEAPLLAAVKATGAKIWSSATTVEEARWLEAKGVDAVIAQGFEAGGHRGMFLNMDISQQMGTFALVPNIVRAVKCPVIAAGGISNYQTAKLALELGATSVQVGTAFLLADEAKISAAHRAALQSVQAEHTVVTNLLSGRYARGIPNRLMQECGPIHADALAFPLAGNAIGLLKAQAEKQGKYDFSSFWAGQNALLASPGTAKQIMARLCGNA